MNFGDIKNIHFVGIGGIGMSGIAEILSHAGFSVSGCDAKRSAATDLLRRRGVRVDIGHDPAHLDGVDLVVVTAAVKGEHAEMDAARRRGIRIMKRAEALGAIVNQKRAVGVSGTHGKTTTSAMIAVVLQEAGLDPTVLVGGMVRNFETNAKSGGGDVLVVEADEYARTFHSLHPEVAVVTNVEADHLEYYGSFEAIVEAFRLFLENVKPGGLIVACIDDPNVVRLLDGGAGILPAGPKARRPTLTYGLSDGADLRAVNLQFHERGTSFEVPGLGFFKLFLPGEHNVRNALAAIAVARYFDIPYETIAAALAKFLGVDRRFQILGDYLGALVVDDYAHHPTEIRATLNAARSGYPERRIVALFQPHLFSRTRDFAREFGESLRVADVPIVAPIYAAREEPVDGVSARIISDSVPGIEFLDRSNAEIVNEMRRRLRPRDIFITMGAGDVHEIAEELVRGGAS
ncbi:MAG TPA: UDP-N-acetylmuramate--L-alanine ligase [Thermoanaerobaculia bacterium]|jgi:UDP-N-acetylmuramate--alanine ligase|nr:UDP-N-acetylmuramate--L-alanine ligase [Thermoanaerobaculia bacterium]